MIETDPKWPGHVFNTTCLIGPSGILYKYRKVNTWIPYEVHTSPHDLPGYDEPLFPVADTPIGRIGCAICYDWLFPEAIRQLAVNGAEVLVRVSAYMDLYRAGCGLVLFRICVTQFRISTVVARSDHILRLSRDVSLHPDKLRRSQI